MCRGARECHGHLSFGVLQEVNAKMDLQVPKVLGVVPVKDKRGGRETLRPQCYSDTCERRGEGRRVGRKSLRLVRGSQKVLASPLRCCRAKIAY